MNPIPQPRYGTIDAEYLDRLSTTPGDDDGPVWMINLMHYRDIAEYGDGRETTISGKEADDLYTPLGPLAQVGAEIVFAGEVDQQLLGDAPSWDRVAVVKYPTRRAFIEMQLIEEFQELHQHKDAGMEQTIVIGGVPIDGVPLGQQPGAPSWGEVPHPPTDDDGPVTVVHVLRFDEAVVGDQTPDDMEQYQNHAGQVAVPHGVRLGGWFGVDGTIIGDGREWHQVRFNEFPSKAAFMAVVMDPDRLAAQRDHREVAIADTYTMIVRPLINTLAPSQT